jgi:cell division protein ZapA (FtsZ GTPase activity inhibitor)
MILQATSDIAVNHSEVVRIAATATDVDAAVALLRSRFEWSEEQAVHVLNAQFRSLTLQEREKAAQELRATERQASELNAVEEAGNSASNTSCLKALLPVFLLVIMFVGLGALAPGRPYGWRVFGLLTLPLWIPVGLSNAALAIKKNSEHSWWTAYITVLSAMTTRASSLAGKLALCGGILALYIYGFLRSPGSLQNIVLTGTGIGAAIGTIVAAVLVFMFYVQTPNPNEPPPVKHQHFPATRRVAVTAIKYLRRKVVKSRRE